MATINKKAIKGILDYDAEINRRAYNITKKQVKKWKDEEEEPEEEKPPNTQYSMDPINAAREITARIKVALEQRQASLDSILTAASNNGKTTGKGKGRSFTRGCTSWTIGQPSTSSTASSGGIIISATRTVTPRRVG